MCHKLTLINLHPAPPDGPAGTWQEVIWQLIDMKSYESGVMIHIVTPELDKGPPITYCLYKIRDGKLSDLWKKTDEKLQRMSLNKIKDQEGEGNALFQMIRKEGVKRELPLLFETIRFLSCGRIKILNKKVYVNEKEYIGGVCLSEEVEQAIANNFN
jgi:phosphoribosylglycinamide formyltransferase-1